MRLAYGYTEVKEMENQNCIHTINGEHGPMSVDMCKLLAVA